MTRFHLVSLGCDKNLVDSEFMLGLMSQHGFVYTQDESEAEVIIINTCSFIHDAKQESIDEILRLNEYRANKLKCLLVTGCLAQRYSDEILEQLPEVDAVLGTADFDEVVNAVNEVLKRVDSTGTSELDGGKVTCIGDINRLTRVNASRVISTPGHYEFLKIAEGCNKKCTYCAIPSFRGSYRSYPMEELIEQATAFAQAGVKELILVAQETTVYGLDLYGKKSLSELLCKLSEIDGIEWIRIMYAYPEEIDDELINVMSTNPKVLHYLDMPIQHGTDKILQKMGRRTSSAMLRDIISRLRAAMPDICIRTTLIAGFPGESQEEFEELYNFVNEMEFDRLGVFAYSREEDTVAATLPDQIDDEIKEERLSELMELQQEIIFEKNEELVGETFTVIVEGYLPEDDVYVTRTYRDAPDVDGFLFLKTERSHMTGDMAYAKVTGAYEYDLNGEEIYESAE